MGLLPGNPEAHQLMASCLLSQQLPDKAREALMKGLSLWLPSCSEKREQKKEEGEKEEEKTEQVQLRANERVFFFGGGGGGELALIM